MLQPMLMIKCITCKSLKSECENSFNIEIKHKISPKIAIIQVKNRFQINASTNVNDQMHYMQES